MKHHITEVLWITDDGAAGPDAPATAIPVPLATAVAWLGTEALPPALRPLRARGATAAAPRSASRQVRKAARRLAARLNVSSPTQLAEVADDLGLDRLAAALRTWPARTPLTHANLCSAAAPIDQDGRRYLDDTARLLLALEHQGPTAQ